MRKWLALCLLLFLSVASGCGFPQATGGHTETFYRMTDAVGREVVLAKKPERIIILAPSFLNIMHAVGGDFIAWADSPGDKAPSYAAGKKTVGYTFQVNAEAVISEKPDLVIGLHGLHDRFTEVMKQNGIPFMLLSASSLEDVERAAEVLGDVTGHHAEGVKAREQLRKDMESVVSGLSLKEYTCAILHGTPHSVTLEGDDRDGNGSASSHPQCIRAGQ